MSVSTWKNQITLRRVFRTDWAWISAWFEDEWLNRELGPMDEEWLEHVLSDKDGVELVAQDSARPVGLVGIKWATLKNPCHGVTDLAINPSMRRQGLGRAVLSAAMNWHGHPNTDKWVAYVDSNNKPPAALLKSLGWAETSSENNMRKFVTEGRRQTSANIPATMPVNRS